MVCDSQTWNKFCSKIMVIYKKKGLHLTSVSYFSIFVPKIKVFSKKKRPSPKFGNYFLQLIIANGLKLLTLPKFFISLPEKLWFCPNTFLSLPEKFEFYRNLGNLGGNCPPAPRQVQLCCACTRCRLLFALHFNYIS